MRVIHDCPTPNTLLCISIINASPKSTVPPMQIHNLTIGSVHGIIITPGSLSFLHHLCSPGNNLLL